MNISRFKMVAAITLLALVLPVVSSAAGFNFSAWLPFWKKQPGAQQFALQMEKFNSISPFSYEVNPDGSLKDSLKMKDGFWADWMGAVKDGGVKIIPTIAIVDGDQIHALLSNKTRRIKHEDIVAALVKSQKYDGVDIDYEGKWAKTRPYFDLFITGLADRLHAQKKTLSCTVEGRTPVDSLYTASTMPEEIKRSNNYVLLNQKCDEVRIMAYDQGPIDLKLDAKKGADSFYMPVADKDWVEKVIKETLKFISKKKVVLGVPTYGYEYEVSWKDGVTTYKRLRANTFNSAMDLAELLNVIPQRNNAGEMSFVYASSTPIKIPASLTYVVASSTPPTGLITAPNSVTRYVTFNDATSMLQKINLAKKYGLKGVAFFKMDGETDPGLWNLLR